MPAAWLVVRATVADPADRAPFDAWYQREHLPDAMKAFAAVECWRGWSELDPAVHCAHYRFESLDRLNAIMNSDILRDLVAEFDRHWLGRVVRTRDVLPIAGELEAADLA
jgi:hypothetical protein